MHREMRTRLGLGSSRGGSEKMTVGSCIFVFCSTDLNPCGGRARVTLRAHLPRAAIRFAKTWPAVLGLALLLGPNVAASDSSPFSSIVGVNYSRQYATSPLP